jgi:hypothetical protein
VTIGPLVDGLQPTLHNDTDRAVSPAFFERPWAGQGRAFSVNLLNSFSWPPSSTSPKIPHTERDPMAAHSLSFPEKIFFKFFP